MKKILMLFLLFMLLVSNVDNNINLDVLSAQELYNLDLKDNTIVEVIVDLKESSLIESYLDNNTTLDFIEYSNNKQVDNSYFLEVLNSNNIQYHVEYEFDILINGYSLKIFNKDVDKIKQLDCVDDIALVEVFNASSTLEGEELYSTNIYNTSQLDYKGEGMLVAVLDSGFNINHDVFKYEVDSPKYTKSNIDSIYQELNSYKNLVIKENSFYHNSKVVYSFDYADNDSNVYSSRSHGSHVAGIVGGYSDKVQGSAYEVQLALMKVFEDSNDVTNSTDLLLALEDCIKLDVDVINLSLGTTAGFSLSDNNLINTVYQNIESAGISLIVSAGNDASVLDKDDNVNSPSNPDSGMISAPSSYYGATTIANGDAYGIHYTSSWGPLPNLKFEPDITAHGTNVYSSSANSYTSLTGTSMAAPNYSGLTAIMRQYLSSIYPDISKVELTKMCNQVLMSTTDIVLNNYNVPVSVRSQGAGKVNINKAINTKAYLDVDDQSKTKLELFDSNEGIFNFSFNINNMSTDSLSYNLDNIIFTESVSNNLVSKQSYKLSSNIKFYIDDVEVTTVSLSSLESITVKCILELNDIDKEYIDTKFENGMYIEGFIVLDGDIDLSIPLLGFYGDWTEAPIFMDDAYDNGDSRLIGYIGDTEYTLGVFQHEYDEEKYQFTNNVDNTSISNNLKLTYVELFLYRNATTIVMTLTNNTTSTDIKSWNFTNASKTYYLDTKTNIAKIDLRNYLSSYKFVEGEEYQLTFKASLDYEKESNNIKDTQIFKFTIDNKAPELIDYTIQTISNVKYLNLDMYDYGSIQSIRIKNTSDLEYDVIPVTSNSMQIDISSYGQYIDVIIDDYSFNEIKYSFSTEEVTTNISKNINTTVRIAYKSSITKKHIIRDWSNIDNYIVLSQSDDVIQVNDSSIKAIAYGESSIVVKCLSTNQTIEVKIIIIGEQNNIYKLLCFIGIALVGVVTISTFIKERD